MTEQNHTQNYFELLQEFDNMRQTLMGFVQLIKQQNDRITALENALAGVELPSPEQRLLDRFAESSKHNRNLSELPQKIAFAAHLAHVRQVPNMRISECGLLSQSKMHGLGQWTTQHLMDYCTLNDVMDIYQNGLSDDDMRKLLTPTGYDKLTAYLNNRKTQ